MVGLLFSNSLGGRIQASSLHGYPIRSCVADGSERVEELPPMVLIRFLRAGGSRCSGPRMKGLD